jgi:hypothetical protein
VGRDAAGLFQGRESFPKVNADAENELRSALLGLGSAAPEKAAAALQELASRHGWRRETVWPRRGEAHLAHALEHLAIIAQASALPSHDAPALAEAYLTEGWKADWAAMRALDIARTGADREAADERLGLDGAHWLIEGRRGNVYSGISRWRPRGELFALGRLFLNLAGPPLSNIKLY